MLCWEELSNQKPNYLEKKSRKHPTFFTLFIYRIAQAKRTHLGIEWEKMLVVPEGPPKNHEGHHQRILVSQDQKLPVKTTVG